MTLNDIVENIAYSLGDQFNDTLRQALKHTVIIYRAKLIKDELDRNFMSYPDYLQYFYAKLIKIDKTPYCDTCKLLRTETRIAKPLRIKGLGKAPYKFVGQVDSGESFVYSQFEEFKYLQHLKYQHNTIYYTWSDGYIYILNNLRLCNIKVESIFSDPRDINISCEDSKTIFADDREFPISEALLVIIRKGIISGEFQIIGDGEEITLKNDNN